MVLMRQVLTICLISVRLSLAELPRLRVGTPQPAYSTHTKSRRRSIVDDLHREYVLRGVNIGLEWWADAGRPVDPNLYSAGRCPTNLEVPSPKTWQWKQPPVCGVDAGKGKWAGDDSDLGQNDLAQIRAAGFNVVRLAVSWSLIEPQPGEYSRVYIQRIDQVVRWATEQDVWVIIDFHQDSYSYFTSPNDNADSLNRDGAPAWACPAEAAYSDDSIISKFDRIAFEEALGHSIDRGWLAFEWFWRNEKPRSAPRVPQYQSSGTSSARTAGLQEHYIKAMAEVVRQFRGNPTVLGYEIMNEPLPGIDINPFRFSSDTLYPFYKRVVQSLTGVRDNLPNCDPSDPYPVCKKDSLSCPKPCAAPDLGLHDDKIYFFEPIALRNQLDFSPQLITKPWTTYKNIAYSPHTYTGSFTLNHLCRVGSKKHCPERPPFKQSLETAWVEANAMNASVFVTEYGCSTHLDDQLLVGIVEQQDRQRTSSTFWNWKENAMHGGWSLFDVAPAGSGQQNGLMNTAKRAIISRVRPQSVVGQLLSFRYEPTNQTFAMRARVAPRLPIPALPHPEDVESEVFIPAHVKTDHAELVLRGCKLRGVQTRPDGSRVVRIMPPVPAASGTGSIYSVQLGDRHDSLLSSLLVEEKETAHADQHGAFLEAESMLKLAKQAIRYL